MNELFQSAPIVDNAQGAVLGTGNLTRRFDYVLQNGGKTPIAGDCVVSAQQLQESILAHSGINFVLPLR